MQHDVATNPDHVSFFAQPALQGAGGSLGPVVGEPNNQPRSPSPDNNFPGTGTSPLEPQIVSSLTRDNSENPPNPEAQEPQADELPLEIPIFLSEMEMEKRLAIIAAWLHLLVGEEHIVELRAIKVKTASYRRPHTEAGFFDSGHFEEMAEQALDLTSQASGVYFTLNPLKLEILARRFNRVDVAEEASLATDKDVLFRRWLLVDADPVRMEGISATDQEKAAALKTILEIQRFLGKRGWPNPIVADSGNGYHLLYSIHLPIDDNDLVKAVLNALADQFDTEAVKIDRKVFNPSRICKLYGTLARKGDHTEQRPHRWTGILQYPSELHEVSRTQLEEIVPLLTKQAKPAATSIRREKPGPKINRGWGRPDREQVLRRAQAYLRKIPPAISGQGGHNQTYHAACVLILGFDLSVEEALPLLEDWNKGCQPPWTEKELLHKLEDADKKDEDRGNLLGPELNADHSNRAVEEVSQSGDFRNELTQALDDPDRLARLFLERNYGPLSAPTLRFWCEEWYYWREGAYRLFKKADLEAAVWKHAQVVFESDQQAQLAERKAKIKAGSTPRGRPPVTRKVNTSLVNNTIKALASLCLVPSEVQPPCWLDGNPTFPAEEMLSAPNGLVHVPSLLQGSGELLPGRSSFFTTTALDYPIDFTPEAPKSWLNFLNQLWPEDPQSIETLQEWFGYCLLPDTRQQKILFLLGPPRSGKGTIARVLRVLLGKENVAGPTLSSLSSQFGLWPLLGKSLALISDARLSGRSDQAIVIERLLSISGEDAVTVDRKGLEPVTVEFPTRLMIMSNELPNLRDASGALITRLVMLRLTRDFMGREDLELFSRLLPERSGILKWAMEGLHRLSQRGCFQQPASGRHILDQMAEYTSPVRAFVEERCQLSPDLKVKKRDLYSTWKTWCEDRGYEPGSVGNFGRILMAAFGSQIDRSTRSSDPGRHWLYTGIGLNGYVRDGMMFGGVGAIPACSSKPS